MSKYKQDQSLNTWVTMLHEIYGVSQNYAKSPTEVHVHLTEVTGGLGRFLIKKKDLDGAVRFAAKTFAWAVALLAKVKPQDTNLEDILLRKFPGTCPYCHYTPCQCWRGAKPDLDEQRVRDAFFTFAGVARRTPNDFQLMFRRIYSESWENEPEIVSVIITRLFEELAEIAEAIRFFHLYPSNFDNELADFLAWWFALISIMHKITPEADPLLAENILWQAYPGYCLDCQLRPCFCRPGPVRELISKPVPGDLERLDRLTLLFNQAALLEDQQDIAKGSQPATFPLATVRIDLDDFKNINDRFGHAAGDEALRHLASILRLKARERDRVYRAGGDEFVIICSDTSKEEAFGTMRRVAENLRRKPVRWVNEGGVPTEFRITISAGVAECRQAKELNAALESADKAAYESKTNGKDRITMAA